MKAELGFLAGHDLAVYSTEWCPDCARLRRFLDSQGVAYREVSIEDDDAAREKLERETGKRAVPFILVDGARWVRGYHTEASSRFLPGVLQSELRAAIGA